jgi:soluble lytic murein transglycosylase
MPRILALLLLLLATAPARAEPPLAQALRDEQWSVAAAAAARLPDPVAAKLVTYLRLLTPGAATAGEIVAFMRASPDWPQQALLAHRRDQALEASHDDRAVAAVCADPGPVPIAAATALERCAEASRTQGDDAAATALLRRAWIAWPANAAAEQRFLQRWQPALDAASERARFERLAWAGETAAAARELPRLAAADQPRARAWIALRQGTENAAALLAALPTAVRQEPLLALAAARQLRESGHARQAAALWRTVAEAGERAAPPEHRPAFWRERDVLARDLLAEDDAADAFAVAAGETAIDGAGRIDADFLAGFIALRKLDAAARALPFFRALAKTSPAVITQGRAHYWMARAMTAEGDTAAATAEYRAAAAFPSTFYGELAAAALGEAPAGRIAAATDPSPTPAEAWRFAGRELARAAAWAVAWDEPERAVPFLLRLGAVAPDAADRELAARLALGLGLPQASVALAREAGSAGITLLQRGWPDPLSIPASWGVEPALALAVIRQESSFDPATISAAGARGLMQLLPATAELVARRLGLRVTSDALLSRPELNVRLGTAYLASLLGRFQGSVPLAVAAYNAGPRRVQDWLAAAPAAGAGTEAMIDWIEQIPFSETRNYVERVLENLMVYRSQRGDHQPMPLAGPPP